MTGPRVLGLSLPGCLPGAMVLTGEDLQAATTAATPAIRPASSQWLRLVLRCEGLGSMGGAVGNDQ